MVLVETLRACNVVEFLLACKSCEFHDNMDDALLCTRVFIVENVLPCAVVDVLIACGSCEIHDIIWCNRRYLAVSCRFIFLMFFVLAGIGSG